MTLVRRRSERGVSLVALMIAVTIMLIGLAIMLPSWEYVIRNEREEELIFRGYQIADAIAACSKPPKHPATSIEDLVKQRCLRRQFKDPMTKDGKWQILSPFQAPGPGPTPVPMGTTYMGPMAGVASQSKEKGLRRFNGKERYNEWQFRPSAAPPGAGVPVPPGASVARPPRYEWVFIGGRARRAPVQRLPGTQPFPTPRP